MTNQIIIASLIIIIFVICATWWAAEYKMKREILNGYWDASAAFCQRSGISSAHALFRDDSVYLIIDEDDRVILNKCVDISISPWGTIEFSEAVDPIPDTCELRLDAARGMLGLFKDDTLYLELFKNSKASVGVV